LPAGEGAGRRVSIYEEETMLRICLCVLALTAGLSVQALAQAAAPGPKPQAAKPSTMVNLNTATVAELEALPGIGAKVATLIVEYRTKKGPFRKIEELMTVQGIGEKSFLKLRPQLTVGAASETSAQH
jgi:comEA protein